MTVLSRGARVRRGGRRPGWMLLTALLVLAIAASSVLVFTSRVELLKLAVIVALWAAVVAAFVSVIYRRQSDVDQARVRDLKLVYDLQLDREISARREYELTVESQLRRELASELRAQSADEVAALRTELAALRTNLEILFDADLSHRPALETERTTVRAYSDWARTGGDAITDARSAGQPLDTVTRTAENPIIDVPEVKIPAAAPQPVPPPPPPRRHRRAADTGGWNPPPPQQQAPPPLPPQAPQRPQPVAPVAPVAPQPVPQPVTQQAPPPVGRPQQPSAPRPAPPPQPTPPNRWQPAPAEGEWLPPGAPGSNWVPSADRPEPTEPPPVQPPVPPPVQPLVPPTAQQPVPPTAQQPTPPPVSPPAQAPEHRSRHGRPAEPAAWEPPAPGVDGARHGGADTGRRRRAESRHNGEPDEPAAAASPVSRHAGPDRDDEPEAEAGPASGGQSVADLLARLQPASTGGGRRRRRED